MQYEYGSGLIKLTSGTSPAIEQWREATCARMEEVARALREDEIQIESWFTIEIAGQNYLLWYMRAKSIQRALLAMKDLRRPIDKFHFDFLTNVTEANIVAKPLIDLTCE